MRSLIFIILASYAVKCEDDASYYVVEIPEERQDPKPFRVYWNVPTMQCKSKKIPFDNLRERFGIIQNTGDSFRGDEVAILYDPGVFPALLKNETSGKFKLRNGGVPQEGDLERHWTVFRKVLEQSIPDPDFSGIGIIDFESWRPIFRQNFGILAPYKDFSYQIERKQHWFWPEKAIQAKAKQRFEEAARSFMQTTLVIAKELRPFAQWGYYAYPYCFNMSPNSPKENCSSTVRTENDKISWLWQASTALYPSAYFTSGTSADAMARTVRGRVAEAARLRRATPVLPYFWFRYRDGGFLPQKELEVILEAFYNSSASGFIVWGSSSDVNTPDKCRRLLNYTETVLGPAIAKYTKPTESNATKVSAASELTNSGITTWRPVLKDQSANNNTNGLNHNSHQFWFNMENNTQEIIHKVQPGTNAANDNDQAVLYIKRNTLLELLFNILLYKEMTKANNEYVDYEENDVLPQQSNSDKNYNFTLHTTESSFPRANNTIEITSSTIRYTTIDHLNATNAFNETTKGTDKNNGYNTKDKISQNLNKSYNVNLYASEFTEPSDTDTQQITSSTTTYSTAQHNTVDPLNVISIKKDLFMKTNIPNKDYFDIEENNRSLKDTTDDNSTIQFNTLEDQFLAINVTLDEDDYSKTVKEKKETSLSNTNVISSDISAKDLISEIDSQTNKTSEQIYSLENDTTSFDNNSSSSIFDKYNIPTISITTEPPKTIMNNHIPSEPNYQITSTLLSIIVTTIKPDPIVNIDDITYEPNNYQKQDIYDDNLLKKLFNIPYNNDALIPDDYNLSTDDISSVNNDKSTSKVPLFKIENKKEDHHIDYNSDTISSTNSIFSNNESTSKYLFFQTEYEMENSSTESIFDPFSSNESISKDPLLHNKIENNDHQMEDNNDTIPSTDSTIFLSNDEVTSKNPFLEPEISEDEVKFEYITTGDFSSTVKFEDATDPIVRLEEKFDIGDDNPKESEVMAEHLSPPVNDIHSKYFDKENNKTVTEEKEYLEELHESTTDKKIYSFDYNEDYSGNEATQSTTEATTDSVGVSPRADIKFSTYFIIFLIVTMVL